VSNSVCNADSLLKRLIVYWNVRVTYSPVVACLRCNGLEDLHRRPVNRPTTRVNRRQTMVSSGTSQVAGFTLIKSAWVSKTELFYFTYIFCDIYFTANVAGLQCQRLGKRSYFRQLRNHRCTIIRCEAFDNVGFRGDSTPSLLLYLEPNKVAGPAYDSITYVNSVSSMPVTKTRDIILALRIGCFCLVVYRTKRNCLLILLECALL
jgi:hypothetical protein